MKKFLILLAVAGLAWGGYWLWTNDRQKVEEFVGKENIDKVEQRIADLKTGMASSDAAEAIIPTDTATIWKATGPAVYLYSGNPLGKLGAGTIAGIAENQLTPYYEQMELEGTTLCFSDEQNFLLHIKGTDVRGSLKKNSDSSYKRIHLATRIHPTNRKHFDIDCRREKIGGVGERSCQSSR